MKAMCLKKLGRYIESQSSYSIVNEASKRIENKEIVKYVFGLIFLQNQPQRVKQDYVENLETVMDVYCDSPKLKVPISPFYIQGDGWITDKIDHVIRLLKDRSFFRRINKQQIVRTKVVNTCRERL